MSPGTGSSAARPMPRSRSKRASGRAGDGTSGASAGAFRRATGNNAAWNGASCLRSSAKSKDGSGRGMGCGARSKVLSSRSSSKTRGSKRRAEARRTRDKSGDAPQCSQPR